MQEEREGLDRAAVVKFLSRRIKNLKMRARCRHIDLSQSLKLIKQQVESTEEEESIKDAIETELVGRNEPTAWTANTIGRSRCEHDKTDRILQHPS